MRLDDHPTNGNRQLFFANKVYNWLINSLTVQIHCLLCKTHTTNKSPICTLCLECCPCTESFCSVCGLPFISGFTDVCSQCLQKPPAFDVCLSGYLYDFPVNRIVQHIKYKGQLELIRPVTRHLTNILQDYYSDSPWPETIIPVPLHKRRLCQRGYDQALLIAREIHTQLKQTSLKLDIKNLKRVRATKAQQGLDAKSRRKNLRNAFSMCNQAGYKHIALVDDVVTTGETVNEISRLLKQSGVKRVDIWTLARTPAPR